MHLYFDRIPPNINVTLVESAAFRRSVVVLNAGDAFDALALSVEPDAPILINALFAFARTVAVEIERRDRWRAEVVYWSKGLGTLAQYEAEAGTLVGALTECMKVLLELA